MNELSELIKEKSYYTKQDIVALLKVTDKKAISDIYDLAHHINKKNLGDNVLKCGVIEFSNYCNKNCLYCRIRRSNEKVTRFRLTQKEILKLTYKAEKTGYSSVLLQSGDDCEFNLESIADTITQIKKSTKLSVILSMAEKTELEYKVLKDAGADSYILKHETSDPILYRQLHPDLKYSNRIKCLRVIKQLGYDIGSGILVGLPGQTFESIANDILLFKELDIDIIDIGPYLPYPDTPLARKFQQAGGYFAPAIGYFDVNEVIFKIIAITRIVTGKSLIPFTPNFNAINFENGKEISLKRGANMILEDLVSHKYLHFLRSQV
ncbi:MAG: radical SAM protein [Candidatus Gastranaerophilales bacterium]|nr:radical SAM protein [Candidatus Gastranaerophilales bacterium]